MYVSGLAGHWPCSTFSSPFALRERAMPHISRISRDRRKSEKNTFFIDIFLEILADIILYYRNILHDVNCTYIYSCIYMYSLEYSLEYLFIYSLEYTL